MTGLFGLVGFGLLSMFFPSLMGEEEQPLESLPTVSIVRHRISGQRSPAPQAFTLSRSNHRDFQHFKPSGTTWPEAFTYSYEMRSAARKHIDY